MNIRDGILRLLHLALAVCMACILAACKTDLYTKQTEADANSMVAALLENGTPATKKTPDGGKSWSVMVEKEDVARALAVLKAHGLPQEKHVNLGDMFKKEGLISTPTEERVRFIHGVSQELSATLAQIDGVITARVHIVLPNNDPLAPEAKPSSASVFVKYRPQANLTALTPAIKNMVARSIEGLSYANVSVTLVPGSMVAQAPPPESTFAWGWVGLAALMLLVAGIGWVVWRRPDWLPPGLAKRLPKQAGVPEVPATGTVVAS
ncbi:type III secretion protein J [Hydrogenophaga palleronii]|uniref:Lipoprotein n=1 Tax=Hydrogenophaga palleronii TaxID=65655 RepID=A0ABU1WL03_9BURK|nr:type III secretion inner membrane ring lipoprotein SctJ [Hydrogenophaga palleronii]MDR7149959.1 type III secretion protein J [Hydrogenophaga palleronii]